MRFTSLLSDRRPHNRIAFAVRLLAVAAVASAVGGCANPTPTFYQAFGFQCAAREGRIVDIVCNRSSEPGAAKVSRYCYKTLADTNCFDRPDPDRKN